MDLNDKTIALLQPNVSPGRYNLKLQANETSPTIFQKPISQSISIFVTIDHL